MYGYDIESIDDPFVTAADKSVTLGLEFLVPNASLINMFPMLAFIPAWFPGASSHKLFAEVKRLTNEVFQVPMDWAKTSMVRQLEVLSPLRILTIRMIQERRDRRSFCFY